MPHECTDCGRGFDDGSKEMLSGCPNCGGTTFQFRPAGASADAQEPPEPPEPPVNSTVARTVGNAATAVRDLVGTDGPDASRGRSEPEPSPPAAGDGDAAGRHRTGTPEQDRPEDAAQASARSEVVSPDDLPPAPERVRDREPPATPDTDHGVDEERPDLDELRDQLNEQFESIRVLAPGQYELNLMELFDREEYIIALQEDGKYTIQVPERWGE